MHLCLLSRLDDPGYFIAEHVTEKRYHHYVILSSAATTERTTRVYFGFKQKTFVTITITNLQLPTKNRLHYNHVLPILSPHKHENISW